MTPIRITAGGFELGVGFENHTCHPSAGDILFYPGGYGEGRERLRALGEKVLRQGAQDAVFERHE
jgi:hypothetical protein